MLLLTLKAGTNRYAIDVARVIELIPHVELTMIPHAPPFLAGLLGYRGKVIPVIDLGLLLHSIPSRRCLSTRIILVSDARYDHNSVTADSQPGSKSRSPSPTNPAPDAQLLGLIGEQVSDLTYIQPEQVARAPVRLSQAAFLDAIVQTEEGIIQLIAVERIRETALGGYILDQGVERNLPPVDAVMEVPAREDREPGA
jgi:chemotaxis-related protein WspB